MRPRPVLTHKCGQYYGKGVIFLGIDFLASFACSCDQRSFGCGLNRNDSFLTIGPVARKGYGSIALEAKLNGL